MNFGLIPKFQCKIKERMKKTKIDIASKSCETKTGFKSSSRKNIFQNFVVVQLKIQILIPILLTNYFNIILS